MCTPTADPFADIRPFNDPEVHPAAQMLADNPAIVSAVQSFFGRELARELVQEMLGCRSIVDFKRNVSRRVTDFIRARSTFSLSLSGRSRLGADRAVTYITNHRDIVLDSAFLSALLSEINYRMPRIAIGDNLLHLPWVKALVRLNDSFIVRRGNLSVREMAAATAQLSAYIRHTITQEGHSVWIAQREGRAKDSNDTTQPAILKMLLLHNEPESRPDERLRALDIVPASLSYEYDPCDWLKAHELLLKQTTGTYTKAPGEDEVSMLQGITGYKGRVHVSLCTPLNQLLPQEAPSLSTKELVAWAAPTIDREIYRHYHLYPTHLAACELLSEGAVQGHVSAREREEFLHYLDERVAMAIAYTPQHPQVPREGLLTGTELHAHPHYSRLHRILVDMYARPVLNARAAGQPVA